MLFPTPDPSDLPDWLSGALLTAMGATGFQLFRAWLENRRLGDKGIRDTLLERINMLEAKAERQEGVEQELRAELVRAQLAAKQEQERCDDEHGS